jgi:hypothetical protein
MITLSAKWLRILLAVLGIASLAGCASFGRGVGEAVMKSAEKKDTRKCWVRGRAFPGAEAALEHQDQAAAEGRSGRPVLKVMMVHGIGSHVPGYATRLAENLARALSLDRVQEKFKEYQLSSLKAAGQELGTLRVTRYLQGEGAREMVFYELAWDPIVEAEKRTVAFDNSGEYSFRRTTVNNTLKLFVNDTVPDVLMYNGRFREPIQLAVGQSLCWMMSETWGDLPDGGTHNCDALAPTALERVQDDFVFITHSLGSRVTADALQTLAAVVKDVPALAEKMRILQDKRLSVIMLSNQVPLLELGQLEPEVHGQFDAICTPGAPRADERLFQETRIVAFSDPNDLFSYVIPPKFLDTRVDSRLCPTLTNVILNVAPIANVPGLGGFASPMAAHMNYDNDERVIALITHGIGSDATAPVIRERCEWIEAVPEER